MINIYFSKKDDIFEIKSDKELPTFYSAALNAYQFKNIGENRWQKQTFDEITVIEDINKIFGYDEFQIIPNDEIKIIEKKRQEQLKEYEIFSQLGLEIKNNKNPDLPKIESKEGFELLPFQKMPVKHMVTIPNCANFSIPGTGKTIMALAAFRILKNQNKIDQMWIIGPIASFKAWEDEYENLFNKQKQNNVLRYHGSPDERDILRNRIGKHELIITSYGTAVNDSELIKRYWRINNKKIFLILDESHHIKSIEEDTTSGNLSIAAAMIDLGKFAERRCILTGTPIPRDLEDLWSQITFLWPNIEPFGKRTNFLELLEEFDREQQVRDLIDFMWTRVTNRELESEMPPRYEKTEHVEMDSKQQEIYRIIESQILNEMPEGADKEKVREWKKAKIIRLLQVVTDPKLIIEKDDYFQQPKLEIESNNDKSISNIIAEYRENDVTPKIKKVVEKTRKLISEKKNILIFTVFRGNVTTLAKELIDEKPLCVTGVDAAEIREATFEKFKNWDFSNGKGKILIATLGSIAESISLHKNKEGKPVCQNVIYLERNYNGGQYMQSLYRVYRIGSNKKLPVNYYFYESMLSDNLTTLDRIIKDVLDTRLNRMYDMLDDEFSMTPMSLGADDDDDDGFSEPFDVNDTEDDIMKKITANAKARKKTN